MASEGWMWQSNGSVHTCQVQTALNSASEAFLTSDQRDWGRYTPGIWFNCCLKDFNRQMKNFWEDSMVGRRCSHLWILCLLPHCITEMSSDIHTTGLQQWMTQTLQEGQAGGWQWSLPFVWESSRKAWSSALRWVMSQRRVSGQDYQEDLYYQYCGGCLPWTPWLGRRPGGLQPAGRSFVLCTLLMGNFAHPNICSSQQDTSNQVVSQLHCWKIPQQSDQGAPLLLKRENYLGVWVWGSDLRDSKVEMVEVRIPREWNKANCGIATVGSRRADLHLWTYLVNI